MNRETFDEWCELVYAEHKCDPMAVYLTPFSRTEWTDHGQHDDWPTSVMNHVTGRAVQILDEPADGGHPGLDHFLSVMYLYTP